MRNSVPIPTSDWLAHGGPGSGRYPLGSGERPYQHRLGGKLAEYEAKEAKAKSWKKSIKYGDKAFEVRDKIFKDLYGDRIESAKQLGYSISTDKYSYGNVSKKDAISTKSGKASLYISRSEPRAPFLTKEQIKNAEEKTKKHYSSIEKDAIKLVEKEAQEIANDWARDEWYEEREYMDIEAVANGKPSVWTDEARSAMNKVKAPQQKVGKNMKVSSIDMHLDESNAPETMEIWFDGSKDVGYHYFLVEYDVKSKKLHKRVEMNG